MDLVIAGGTVVTAEGVFEADIGLREGRIVAVGQGLSGRRRMEARGRLITPGGVDVHVHLQYHVGGLDTADDFASGSRAAVLGGTTTFLDFVETRPGQTMLEALQERRQQAEGRSVADFGFHMTVQPADLANLDQVAGVVEAGCPTFKHYMAYGFCLDDGQLLTSFRALAAAGGMALVHAENWDVIRRLVAESLEAGLVHPRMHPRCRPAAFEGQAAGRVLDLAELTGTPVYLFHVTCREVVERLAAARSGGKAAWGETCPQYLCLDDEVFERLGPLPICSPPIREKAQQQSLQAALLRGDLQVVSTDHCPFSAAEKNQAPDFSRVPGGVPALESRMMLVRNLPGMTLSRWVDVCCTTPARVMGLTRKGRIQPGCDADLVLWDPRRPCTRTSTGAPSKGSQPAEYPRPCSAAGRWWWTKGAWWTKREEASSRNAGSRGAKARKTDSVPSPGRNRGFPAGSKCPGEERAEPAPRELNFEVWEERRAPSP